MNLTNLDYKNLFEILKYTKRAYNDFQKVLNNNENTLIANLLTKIFAEFEKQYNDIYKLFEKNEKAKEMLVLDNCCNNCHNKLLVSDNIDYTYQCEQCDENFYDFETFEDDRWFDDEEESIELDSSFNVTIDYDKNLKTIWIGSENGSGAKYHCNNIRDLINNIEKYFFNNYLNNEKEKDGEITYD